MFLGLRGPAVNPATFVYPISYSSSHTFSVCFFLYIFLVCYALHLFLFSFFSRITYQMAVKLVLAAVFPTVIESSILSPVLSIPTGQASVILPINIQLSRFFLLKILSIEGVVTSNMSLYFNDQILSSPLSIKFWWHMCPVACLSKRFCHIF